MEPYSPRVIIVSYGLALWPSVLLDRWHLGHVAPKVCLSSNYLERLEAICETEVSGMKTA